MKRFLIPALAIILAAACTENKKVEEPAAPIGDRAFYEVAGNVESIVLENVSGELLFLGDKPEFNREGHFFVKDIKIKEEKEGDFTILRLDTDDDAYFFIEGKDKYIVMDDGTRYYMDRQTDAVLKEIDPQLFFRVSRNYIISFHAIRQIEKLPDGRLRVTLVPQPKEDVLVARLRVQDFMDWLA